MNLQVTDSTANAERALLFESVGKNLNKAQEAFDTASKHLKTYRGRVSALSGQKQLELDAAGGDGLPLTDKASA